jgi:hypothetical protein
MDDVPDRKEATRSRLGGRRLFSLGGRRQQGNTRRMSWWSKLRDGVIGRREQRAEGPSSRPAKWLAADDAGNPFDVPILDLMGNLSMISTSEDPEIASRSVSWRAGQHERLQWKLEGERIECDLSYGVAATLPDGMLFVPEAMEDKWVIAWRQGQIAAARSWSGETEAVAEARLADGELRVTSLTLAARCSLRAFGDPVATFDWLLKSHALGARIPLPVSAEGAELLRDVPLASFGPFGRRVFCAAVNYAPPASKQALRSDGALITAMQDGDAARVQRLVGEGHDLHAPSTFRGYTALHLAVVKGRADLVELLLSLGANPNQVADQKRLPLPLALVHQCSPQVLDLLLDAGAELEGADEKGFTALHAAAEVGNVAGIHYLLGKGAKLQARTTLGFSPLHIACALGHLDAARELVRHGADAAATSELGTPLDAARQEGKAEVVNWLESL